MSLTRRLGARCAAIEFRQQPNSAALFISVLVVGISIVLSGCSKKVGTEITTPSGLKYVDEVVGTGDRARLGRTISVHYTGTLLNGSKFDSSLDRGQPFEFRLGTGAVIPGWDEGILGMQVGGKRKLIVPPELGYGAQAQNKIPANSTLIFEVELLSVK